MCVLGNRLRRNPTGSVPERRVHQYPVSVWDSGKPISIAKEARQVVTFSLDHVTFYVVQQKKCYLLCDL